MAIGTGNSASLSSLQITLWHIKIVLGFCIFLHFILHLNYDLDVVVISVVMHSYQSQFGRGDAV